MKGLQWLMGFICLKNNGCPFAPWELPRTGRLISTSRSWLRANNALECAVYRTFVVHLPRRYRRNQLPIWLDWILMKLLWIQQRFQDIQPDLGVQSEWGQINLCEYSFGESFSKWYDIYYIGYQRASSRSWVLYFYFDWISFYARKRWKVALLRDL